jgi:hypothetical protein
MSSSSSLLLMCVYTVIVLAFQAVTIGVVGMLEPFIGGWAASIYMTLFLLVFWPAWVVAVRLTEPKTAGVKSAQPVKA